MSTKPAIIYDARWLLLENRFDGISRYSHELAHALAKRGDLDITWLIYDERQLAKLPAGPHIIANNPSDGLRECFALPRLLNSHGAKLVYSPFFIMGTLGKRYKLVLTIHDMIYFHHRTPPAWYPWHTRLGWRLFHLTKWPMRWQLNRANIVATVSKTARQELIDSRATRREIITVSNAVSQRFNSKKKMEANNNVLYMGAFTPYKNVECLIDAMQYLPDVTLHLLSPMPAARRNTLTARMREKGVLNQIAIHNGVTDEQYRQLLAQCRCLVTASRIEGFGLPIIEAQRDGTPVACSDTPIFREVAGKSAVFFDPNDPKSCADAIERFADPSIRQRYVNLGRQNVARFTWDASADITAKIIKKIDS